ncbi:wd repeat domain-containing phosphoinositide-interacting protein 4 [Diaporthe amygdali]|uniref:wd repeat domain-containing phosphoinositide-interacting protein 4 n=1 Tax=Phomopsis amygdali TaxID=1214568 RepID=UPI0022FF18D1|nr:wd repeat domain-containing phosphoinositide-interacting protein 4 [Diaporthe amygdali]KAJ0123244.1 wd repeat domain-containing phosphoinositide-interacting protein 4 [Diaporthe amygdali]
MDTRPKIEPDRPIRILSVDFSDSGLHFAVGLEDGFRIIHSDSGQMSLIQDLAGGIGLAQMLGQTNIVALVGGGRMPKFAANKVFLWEVIKKKPVASISVKTPVRAVRINREKVIIVLQNSVEFHAPWNRPKEMQKVAVYETADNLHGLICMSAKHIAFPGPTAGHVRLVELATDNVSIIPAHSTALRAMAFSDKGDMLATASDKGTLIRIWNTRNCARICELRRGLDSATIFSLGFSRLGNILACTSDKGTLHVFDVPSQENLKDLQSPSSPISLSFPASRPSATAAAVEEGRGKWGLLGKMPFMPRAFSDQYSFASAPFEIGDEPTGGLPALSNIASLGTTKPPKGILAWTDEDTIIVVGAGIDARWEKFKVELDDDGRRRVRREGWKRYYKDM